MAQTPAGQNYFHHPHSLRGHQHVPPPPPGHPQLHLPQFRNPFDLLFEERTNSAMNYNYMRPPYLPNQLSKPDELNNDSLVMRRPRRTRTTFTSAQITELEQHFLQSRYLTASRLGELSTKLGLGTAQVKIWFKNRRRRHKIQSDQQKEYLSTSFSCENGMQISPSLPSISKPELNGVGAPPHLASATPTTLTPSPTPSSMAATASHMEPYCESLNPASYYYNNNQHCVHAHSPLRALGPPPPPPPMRQHATARQQPHYARMQMQQYLRPSQPPPISAHAASAAQFFMPPPAALQHQQQHHHNHFQHQQSTSYYQEQRRYHGYQPHKAALASAPLFCGAGERHVKDEPDYNFNSPYYVRMSDDAASAPTSANEVNHGDGPTSSALSPHPDVYEPLTPKNDESPSLANGGGRSGSGSNSSTNSSSSSSVGMTDDMDETNTTKTLQILAPIRNSAATDDACANDNSLNSINMADCSGAFAKYTKLATMASETHEPTNYQCTMDTIMHAYTHRTAASSTTQFAYCFN